MMRTESNNRFKSCISKVAAALLFCLTAVFSGSALSAVLPSSTSTWLILSFGAVCSAITLRVLAVKQNGMKECFYYFFIVWLLVCSLIHPEDTLGNLNKILIISIAYYITERYSIDGIIKTFAGFCVIVAIAAMIGTFLLNYTNILNRLPLAENLNGVIYRFGLIYNYIVIIPERVCGFFWEPGLLATCMVYGIAIYVGLYAERITKREIAFLVVLLFCCFMANSSAGFVLGVLSVFLVLLRNKKTNKLRGLKDLFQLLIFLVALLLVLNIDAVIAFAGFADNEYVAKLLSSNVNESLRMLAILHNMETWYQNPVLGIGFSEAIASGSVIVSDTSTSTFLMAAYGVGGVVYTVAIIVGVFTQKRLNIYSKIVLCTLLLFVVNKEPHFGLLFTWVLIFMLLNKEPIAKNEIDS